MDRRKEVHRTVHSIDKPQQPGTKIIARQLRTHIRRGQKNKEYATDEFGQRLGGQKLIAHFPALPTD